MNRCLAMIFAMLCATLSVASACTAATGEWIEFTLEERRPDGKLQATFREKERGGDDLDWSTSLAPQHLTGLEVSGFRAAGTRPLRFALVREAGRLDCAGQGGQSRAAGNCRFTVDPRFAELLSRRGIARPSREQTFGLMAVDVRRELVEAIAVARYPAPSIDELMALTAVGVTDDYIADLARLGYRPSSIDALVQFRALNIRPDYVAAFAKAGYGHLDPDELVQLKALDIQPDYVAAFERMGYRNLPVRTLVQLKALGISAEFVRSVETRPGELPPIDDLVQRKLFGRRR